MAFAMSIGAAAMIHAQAPTLAGVSSAVPNSARLVGVHLADITTGSPYSRAGTSVLPLISETPQPFTMAAMDQVSRHLGFATNFTPISGVCAPAGTCFAAVVYPGTGAPTVVDTNVSMTPGAKAANAFALALDSTPATTSDVNEINRHHAKEIAMLVAEIRAKAGDPNLDIMLVRASDRAKMVITVMTMPLGTRQQMFASKLPPAAPITLAVVQSAPTRLAGF